MPLTYRGNGREFMATTIRQINTSKDTGDGKGPRTNGRLCSVARQPILDLRGRVHAYKLLLRGAMELDGNCEALSLTLAETVAFWGL